MVMLPLLPLVQYDNVPHSWIQECLRIFGIADNVVGLLNQSIKSWKLTFAVRGNVTEEVETAQTYTKGERKIKEQVSGKRNFTNSI